MVLDVYGWLAVVNRKLVLMPHRCGPWWEQLMIRKRMAGGAERRVVAGGRRQRQRLRQLPTGASGSPCTSAFFPLVSARCRALRHLHKPCQAEPTWGASALCCASADGVCSELLSELGKEKGIVALFFYYFFRV